MDFRRLPSDQDFSDLLGGIVALGAPRRRVHAHDAHRRIAEASVTGTPGIDVQTGLDAPARRQGCAVAVK